MSGARGHDEDEMPDNMQNWRVFQGTELGSLMAGIYGNQNKPKINYPKPRVKTFEADKEKGFRYCGSNPSADDPRKVTRSDVKVNVPKLNGGRTRADYKQIEFVPKRRNAEKIQEEMDDITMRMQRYRPAHIHNISSDAEKERLSQINTYKGGKALPVGLTLPMGETPLERAEKVKEMGRMNAVKEKRMGLPAGSIALNKGSNKGDQGSRRPAAQSSDEMYAEQIVSEIEERRIYLEEGKELGIIKPGKERELRAEISSKLEELKKYEK